MQIFISNSVHTENSARTVLLSLFIPPPSDLFLSSPSVSLLCNLSCLCHLDINQTSTSPPPPLRTPTSICLHWTFILPSNIVFSLLKELESREWLNVVLPQRCSASVVDLEEKKCNFFPLLVHQPKPRLTFSFLLLNMVNKRRTCWLTKWLNYINVSVDGTVSVKVTFSALVYIQSSTKMKIYLR